MKPVHPDQRPESASGAQKLAASAEFDSLGDGLGQAVESALQTALAAGAVFPRGADPLTLFHAALGDSIYDIENDDRGRGELLQRFLRDGPYECAGTIPPELRGKRLTPDETEQAIKFIYSAMVNSFKGAVTELLAAGACTKLMRNLRLAGLLPPSARLFVGDAVLVPRKSGNGGLKGADLHILALDEQDKAASRVTVIGVAEVKSGPKSAHAMEEQLEKHIRRAKQGLIVAGRTYAGEQVRFGLGGGAAERVLRITVQPSDWPLPRTLRWEKVADNRQLILDSPTPPKGDDDFNQLRDNHWHISLRWSKEAIAAAAYEMTFWYMAKVGEIIYAVPGVMPKDWSEMSPAEAGRNAIKMMLYYAILHMPTGSLAEQRAIALYNSYGFGYAIGMNFRNKARRREMLWPQDLDEIATNGCNKDGCRIV